MILSYSPTQRWVKNSVKAKSLMGGYYVNDIYIYIYFFWHINQKLIVHITLIIIFSLMLSMFLVSSFKSEQAK